MNESTTTSANSILYHSLAQALMIHNITVDVYNFFLRIAIIIVAL